MFQCCSVLVLQCFSVAVFGVAMFQCCRCFSVTASSSIAVFQCCSVLVLQCFSVAVFGVTVLALQCFSVAVFRCCSVKFSVAGVSL